ncbi:Oxalate:formate antiporter [bacterium HR29]|mgnify:CR=1 FL=1|jgi:MFS family permease|nr:Oxalate:formate antiporter [bacterium HR29]
MPGPFHPLARRVFYGWVVVAAAFLCMFVSFGVAYSFGTFFEPLRDEFAANRGAVSLVFALTGFLYFGLGAATGPLADRYGPRAVCMAGAAAFFAGLLVASRAQAVWQVYLSYSLFVGSGVAACYVPSIAAVQRWFVRRRAFASGIAVSGIGLGTIVVPPISSALIDAYGWRTAMVLTGIAAGVLGGVAAWALERSPAELGLRPDGGDALSRPPSGEAGPEPGLPGLGVGEAVRTKAFAWLYAAGVLATAPVFLALGHIVPYGQDEGLSLAQASLGLTGIGIGSMVGRLLLSPFGDRLGRRTAYGASIVGMAVLTYVWFAVPLSSVPALVLWGALFGSAYGAFVALSPTLMADYFGTRAVSSVIGVFYTAAGVGALAGPWLGGVIYDAADSYRPAILAAALSATLGALAVWRSPSPEAVRAESSPRTRSGRAAESA